MLHGSIADKLFLFAMPIGLIGIFEQLFNSADVFLLGHFVGKALWRCRQQYARHRHDGHAAHGDFPGS